MRAGCNTSLLWGYRSDEEIQRTLGQRQFIYYVHWQKTKTECFLTKIGEKAKISAVITLVQHSTGTTKQCNKARKEIRKVEINCPCSQMT